MNENNIKRSFGCAQIKQILSLRYIESCTLLALDKKCEQRPKKVKFQTENNQVSVFSNLRDNIDEEDDVNTTDQEDNHSDILNIEREKRKQMRRERKESECKTIKLEVPRLQNM